MYRILFPILLLAGCADESLSGYAARGPWVLTELDGAAFAARATLELPGPGAVQGEAPCNSWWARQTAPLPWFRATAITQTERGCAAQPDEVRFFAALAAMTQAEVLGGVLILSGPGGREMVFRLADG